MIPTFQGEFANQEDVETQFEYTLVGEEVMLFAEYDNGGYEGSAYVLIDNGGKLEEVYGSHCSCFGLKDQWQPESITPKALRERMTKGRGFYFTEETKQTILTILDKWESDHDCVIH